jgi:hypothetical protein
MENLRSLMQCVDDISKVIPEGTYLEMCNKLKILHDTMPRDDPPVIDLRSLPRRESSQVVTPGYVDLPDDYGPAIYDEYIEIQEELRIHWDELAYIRTTLSKLRMRRNVTRVVRERAVIEKARIEGVTLVTNTFKELCSKVPLLVFVNEFDFYKSYIEYENGRILDEREQYEEIGRDLQEVITRLEHRRNFLRTRYSL